MAVLGLNGSSYATNINTTPARVRRILGTRQVPCDDLAESSNVEAPTNGKHSNHSNNRLVDVVGTQT